MSHARAWASVAGPPPARRCELEEVRPPRRRATSRARRPLHAEADAQQREHLQHRPQDLELRRRRAALAELRAQRDRTFQTPCSCEGLQGDAARDVRSRRARFASTTRLCVRGRRAPATTTSTPPPTAIAGCGAPRRSTARSARRNRRPTRARTLRERRPPPTARATRGSCFAAHRIRRRAAKRSGTSSPTRSNRGERAARAAAVGAQRSGCHPPRRRRIELAPARSPPRRDFDPRTPVVDWSRAHALGRVASLAPLHGEHQWPWPSRRLSRCVRRPTPNVPSGQALAPDNIARARRTQSVGVPAGQSRRPWSSPLAAGFGGSRVGPHLPAPPPPPRRRRAGERSGRRALASRARRHGRETSAEGRLQRIFGARGARAELVSHHAARRSRHLRDVDASLLRRRNSSKSSESWARTNFLSVRSPPPPPRRPHPPRRHRSPHVALETPRRSSPKRSRGQPLARRHEQRLRAAELGVRLPAGAVEGVVRESTEHRRKRAVRRPCRRGARTSTLRGRTAAAVATGHCAPRRRARPLRRR